MPGFIPGTFDRGDRIRSLDRKKQGTVSQDNRRDGGEYVWISWDDEGDLVCVDPAEIRSVR